jgi:GAF domain-containing protein/nitrogen-specific signal transduction histidine kinase
MTSKQPTKRFLLALNQVAGTLQEPEFSALEVLQAFRDSFRQSDLLSLISLNENGSGRQVICVFTLPDTNNNYRQARAPEQIEGLRFDLRQAPVFQRVFDEAKPIYLSPSENNLQNVLPEPLRQRLGPVLQAYQKQATILAPIVKEGETEGAIVLAAPDLEQTDVPAAGLLAKHIALLLQTTKSKTLEPSGLLAELNRPASSRTAGPTKDGKNGRPLDRVATSLPNTVDGQEAQVTYRQLAEELSALHAGSLKIASVQDLPALLQTIIEQAAYLLNASGGSLSLYYPESEEMCMEVCYNTPRDYTGTVLKNGEGVAGRVAQTGQALMIEDYRSWEWRAQVFEADKPFRAVIAAPMIWQGQVSGVVQVFQFEEQHRFSPADLDLLTLFANQAAIAVENARLLEAERIRREEAESLGEIAQVLSSSLDLDEVLDAILRSTLRMLPEAENSHIFLYNSNGNSKLTFGAALWANNKQDRPWSDPRPGGLTYSVAQGGEPIVVSDMQTHPLFATAPKDWTGAIIGLPLKIGSQVVGVMNVKYSDRRNFKQGELNLLRLLGDQAAVAIQNARLFEQAATERRHLRLLYDVGQELATSLDAEKILNRAITLTCQALNGLVGQVFIYTQEDGRLHLRALHGRPQTSIEELASQLQLRLGSGLAGWVAEKRLPSRVDEVAQDARWLHIPGVDEDVHSALCAPILAGEQLLGVMTVLHHQPGFFTKDHLALMQAICQEVGLALSNAHRYQQVQRRLAESTLIQNLTQTFNQRLEVQALLDEVTLQLGQRLNYSQVQIFLLQEGRLKLRAFHGVRPGGDTASEQSIIAQVAESGGTILVTGEAPIPVDQIEGERLRSALAVPILRNEEVIGVIHVQSPDQGQLSSQDQELLEMLAGQVSIALENAVLYERVRNHAEELEQTVVKRTAELSELYMLSQEIGYQLSYADLLHLVLRRLLKALHVEMVAGCLMYLDCRTIHIETSRDLSPQLKAKIRQQWLDALKQNPKYKHKLDDFQFQIHLAENYQEGEPPLQAAGSVIQTPLFINQAMVGLLMAIGEEAGILGDEQARLLDTFANQTATAIQRLAAILTAQQKHLESLVAHMPMGVLLLDDDFKLLVSNPLGQTYLQILEAKFEDEALVQLGPYRLQALTLRYQDPLPIEIMLDVSPRRYFEAHIRPIGEQKSQWVLTLREVTQERENQARIQSQERLATVGQLAAGIAHDFNNIMAAIQVYSDLLRRDKNIRSASREKLTIIQQQVERAASLIRQILDFSRKSVMDPSAMDLLPFTKELIKLLGRILPETIHPEMSSQPGPYWINADPTQLQQVFMNLALNAQDAMPNGGLLRFELERIHLKKGQPRPIPEMASGEWVRILVRDTGIGIPADIQQHVFDPFFTTKPAGQGTGLGLAQVYGIITQHNGYIDVDSQLGQGTSFNIYLPALQVPTNMDTHPESGPRLDGQGQVVLVVEDNEATRLALQALLESQNYRVVEAADGVEAIARFEESQTPIALVVSDVVMPKMGGVALYRTLRKQRPDLKMLFVTGHPLDIKNQALLEMGGVHWLHKPFSLSEFNQAVSELMQTPA